MHMIRSISMVCGKLILYGVGGNLLKAVLSVYTDSRVCILVGNNVR